MRLDRLILDNFLTYEHLDYEFEAKPLQIQGLNLTDEKQKSNGTGKSGMQTGIEFCITASNSRDVRDVELVSYGCKEARSQLFASCDVRKESIHIDWTIKAKGSNKLTLSKKPYGGEWEEISFSNVNDGKKAILAWFAISKEDLFSYYIINKTRFKSFFKTSNKEKVDLINRFSDASIVDGIEKIDNSELDSQYSGLETDISKLDGKIELADATIIREISRDFSAELTEEEEEIREEIEEIESNIETEKNSIEEIKANKLKLASRIDEIEEEKEGYIAEKVPINEKLELENKALKEIGKELEDAKLLVTEFVSTDWDSKRKIYQDEIDEIDEQKGEVEAKQETQDEQEARILGFLKGIETKLSGAITCPSCTHVFTLDGDIDTLKAQKTQGETLLKQVEALQAESVKTLREIKESVTNIESSISGINKQEQAENENKNSLQQAANAIQERLNSVKSRIGRYDDELKQLDLELEDCDGEISKIGLKDLQYDQDIKNCNTKIKNFGTEIENYKTQISNLSKGDNKAIIEQLKKDLESYKAEKSEKETLLEEVGDKIYERNQWSTNFKQFRMYLANQSLEAIEFHCNRYLAEMGSDLKVKMEGFKVLANGTLKDEITAKVIRGVERSFSSFSGGEQGRLLFASILANRHMINSTHPYGGLDFLSVDEVFEGVDSVGLKHLILSAKQLQIAVMIITHVTDEDTSEDILTIVKENGVSTIRKN